MSSTLRWTRKTWLQSPHWTKREAAFSPTRTQIWFNERRHSGVDEIKAQLSHREENKQKVAQFRTTRSFGDYWYVFFDANHHWFTVSKASRSNENENPDIIDDSSITGCRFDIDEHRSEIYRKDKDGKNVSYNPPRYKYSYEFNLVINIEHPYFDEIIVPLSCGSVNYEPQQTVQVSLFRRSLTDNGANPENCPEYRKYRDMGQAMPKFCPECGAPLQQ